MLDFVDEYVKSMQFEPVQDGYELRLPFELFNAETPITLHLQKKDGYISIDDRGYTMQYLDFNDVDLNDYKDDVEIICEMFRLKIEDGLVKSNIGYIETLTFKELHSYLQGLGLLATIHFLD